MVADSNRSPGSNVGPDYGFDLIKPVIAPRKRSKYPGRNRVMARQDAIEFRERQMLAEWADRDDPLPCLAPYMVEAIVVPSGATRSAEHTSDLQSLMHISYAVFCLKKNNTLSTVTNHTLISRHNHHNSSN